MSLSMRDEAGEEAANEGEARPLDLRLPAPEALGERVSRFRAALLQGNEEAARTEWMFTTDEERAEYAGSFAVQTDLFVMVRVLGIRTINIMGQLGITFEGRKGLAKAVFEQGMGHWADAMVRAGGGIWDSFIADLPSRLDATDEQARAWRRFVEFSNTTEVARDLFERVYPPLEDETYDEDKVKTEAWEAAWIERLYRVLSEHLPVSHVNTATGFYIGTKYKKDGEFQDLGFAWWTSFGKVVLPKSSARDGGGSSHSMVGGANAQVPVEERGGGGGGSLSHFDTSALHEIGHGVGQRLGGNTWTMSYPFVGWKTRQDPDVWSKKLWGDDDALTERARREASGAPILPADEARLFLAHDLAGDAYKVTAAGFESEAKVESFIRAMYKDQPLTRYWERVQGNESDSYELIEDHNVSDDGRVYVWLSRGNSGLSSYQEQALEQKVSWYSLSSPKEWFAEQYTAYYAASPRGAGMEQGTKEKLDELHETDFEPPEAPEIVEPDWDSGGASAGESRRHRRAPFPW